MCIPGYIRWQPRTPKWRFLLIFQRDCGRRGYADTTIWRRGCPSNWNALWRWYLSGGLEHVAAYLRTLDLSLFDPKAPPPKTDAFWAIVDAHHAPEASELADVLDILGKEVPGGKEREWPDAVTILEIANAASAAGAGFLAWITDRKNRRAIPHRMEQCGYVPVRNDRNEGRWIIKGTRQVVYARSDLSIRDRFLAAQRLER
jgi:hypothetical protein